MDHKAVTELPSGVVVDKAKLNSLTAADMAAMFAEVYALGKRVVIVENSMNFFSSKELFRQLDDAGTDWPLICEKFDITLDASDRICLERSLAIRKALVEAINGAVVPYVFDDIPENWSVERNIIFTGTLVYRKHHNNDYSIGLKTLQRLWLAASRYWAGVGYVQRMPVSAAGYNRTAEFSAKSIDVGCQSIRRYEIEQIAVAKGWAFPAA